jgi:SAM-dependent methyltransferase
MVTIRPSQDAFGQMLFALYGGSEVFEIVERDDGYIEAMPAKGYLSEYKDWNQIEQRAMEFAKGRILDVGCGAGRHSLYLQKKGFNVTGIDVSPLTVKICKLRGLKKVKHTSVEKADFKPDTFDRIFMMGNNFGLLANFKKARWLLRKFHRITSKDAFIVAVTNDPYKTDNRAHLAYHRRNRQNGRMSGQLKIRIRYKQYKGKWFEYLLASKQEVEEILKGTGWKIKEFIDSTDEKRSYYLAIIKKHS